MYRPIIISLFLFVSVGCKKTWLDIKANKKQAVPSTLNDFQRLLDNTDVMNTYSPTGLCEVASDGHFITEDSWDGFLLSDAERNAYTWSNKYPYPSSIKETEIWNYPYKSIFYSNLILEGLDKMEPLSGKDYTEFNNIKGQALFQRSRNFYELAQAYVPPFQMRNTLDNYGLPMRLESDITVTSIRSSIGQTYDQIIRDLKESSNLMPAFPLYKTRGSKTAALALLARIYLSMGVYDSAYKYADETLNLYGKLIDYNNYKIIDASSSIIGLFNDEVIFHSVFSSSFFTITTYCLIDPLLYNEYSTDDLRKSIFFQSNSIGVSFIGNYNNTVSLLFNGLATDEMYLIRSECYARQGKVTEAMNDLNSLLEKRFKTGTVTEILALDSEDALQKIILERRKELLLRGVRWSDLRRLNFEDKFKVTVTRSIGGENYSLIPNSNQYTFPIPDAIIQSTGMEQNLGWNK